jgi:hypothetical protein
MAESARGRNLKPGLPFGEEHEPARVAGRAHIRTFINDQHTHTHTHTYTHTRAA